MTKKTEAANTAAAIAKTEKNLRDLRAQIDKLDLQILDLVNKRASIAGQIGRLKNDSSAEPFAPAREEEVFKHVLDQNKGPLDNETIRAIYREIISGSRALQKVLKVAYLGPEYSFSHLAAIERFGQAVDLMKVGSIAAVFEAVNRSHTDFGVVPLENSTDGRVADTLEMFLRMPQLIISAEIRLRIHHNLMAACDQEMIRRVYSKPQALSQCRNWLAKNVPHATLHEVASTATAAELAKREPGAAAVASRQAAVRYGLRILFSDIEDSPYNETRFAVIGQQKCNRTGNDKTALVFRVSHAPGKLADALDVFKQAKINLTWIESFPAKTSKPEYVFFVDFEGHQDDTKVSRAIEALRKQCQDVVILGSFPRSDEPA
jgi:chorismate mutase / prephenate dehydratase